MAKIKPGTRQSAWDKWWRQTPLGLVLRGGLRGDGEALRPRSESGKEHRHLVARGVW